MKIKTSIKTLLSFILTGCFLTSCVSRKEVVYFQGLENAGKQLSENINTSLKIKPNDLLTIMVSAPEQAAAMPFNLPVVGMPQAGNTMDLGVNGRQQLQTYLVNNDGTIQFPILGSIKAADLNRKELADLLSEKVSDYVQNPIVNVRIVNFQVSILGEVARPGTFEIRDEYLSLPKALGLAGDLTIYGKRKNVLVVREQNGQKTHAYIDLTDPDVLDSPFYYLQQNDVVYVEPNGAQVQSASYNRNASVYISIASVLVSLAVLLTR